MSEEVDLAEEWASYEGGIGFWDWLPALRLPLEEVQKEDC